MSGLILRGTLNGFYYERDRISITGQHKPVSSHHLDQRVLSIQRLLQYRDGPSIASIGQWTKLFWDALHRLFACFVVGEIAVFRPVEKSLRCARGGMATDPFHAEWVGSVFAERRLSLTENQIPELRIFISERDED